MQLRRARNHFGIVAKRNRRPFVVRKTPMRGRRLRIVCDCRAGTHPVVSCVDRTQLPLCCPCRALGSGCHLGKNSEPLNLSPANTQTGRSQDIEDQDWDAVCRKHNYAVCTPTCTGWVGHVISLQHRFERIVIIGTRQMACDFSVKGTPANGEGGVLFRSARRAKEDLRVTSHRSLVACLAPNASCNRRQWRRCFFRRRINDVKRCCEPSDSS